MKKKLSIVFALTFSICTFSQSIYLTKRNYSSSPTIFSLQKINQSSGNVIDNFNFTTTFTNSFGNNVKDLTFNSQTNEIFGMAGNTIVKYNITTGVETSFNLPIVQYVDYRDLIIAENKLYVTKRDYSSLNVSTYIHSLQELNQTNGNVISNYNFTTSFPSSYSPESLTFNVITKEIFGISGNTIVKYNIQTGIESSFTMPIVQFTDYNDLIIGNNRLFITKRDYTNSSNYIHSLQEINQTNGNLINNYNFTTTYPNNYSPESLNYDKITNEIWGISGNILTKYNINSGIENSIVLPLATSNDYGEIVSINSEDTLSLSEYNIDNYKSKAVKAYNLLGQEISIETYNQIIIVKFENGKSKKTYNQK